MEKFLDYFVPEWYVLDLAIDKHKKTIGGVVTVFGAVKAETVKFHAVGLGVDFVKIDGKMLEKQDFECGNGVLTLFKVPRSVSSIEVGYHGSLNENMQGAYLSTYEREGQTETIVATQFESHYAREAFPCIDEPAAKAVFELTITTPDKDDIILANTPEVFEKYHLGHTSLRSSVPRGFQGRSAKLMVLDGTFSKTFEPTPRMSTYLLAFVIGKFHGKTIKNAHGVEITTYAASNQDVEAVDFANEVAARSLEFYDDNFGVKYPLAKLTQVALPDFEAGAMENWGLVTYRESMLLAGDSATLDTKKGVALTVAHELSHQWFGDLVTMRWWDDLWLNESFASVMEYYAVDYIYPEYKIWENFFCGDALAALKRDCLSGVQSVHQDVNDPAEIATLFDPAIVYAKGARLMLMVIRMMGWGEFCNGVKEYFEEHAYGNTVGDDLWACLNKYARFEVGEMMHGFIDRPGYPVVTAEAEDFTKFAQKRFLVDGEMEESSWNLPEIREDMSGHYVLDLSEDEFDARLKRFEKLGLEEKLRLLIDRDLLSKTELVASGSLVPLVDKFRDEESAAVWNIIATIVSGLKIFFATGSQEELRYKKFIKTLVKPGLARVGLKTCDGDDENTIRLRAILIALDFYASAFRKDGAGQENLKELAKMYDPELRKIDPEIRNDVLDAKLFLEPECFEEFLAAYKKEADPELKFDLLMAMTLTGDLENVKKMIGLLSDLETVKPQDQFHLFIYLYRNPLAKDLAFSWLKEYWEFVKEFSGDKSLDNYPRYTAGTVKTEEDFKAWREFFEPMADEPALKRATEVGCNEIRARLELIARDRDGVTKAVEKADII